MNDSLERQRAVARWTSGPAPLMRSNVWAAMLILFDPAEVTWALYHSQARRKNMDPNGIKLDSVTADIVMRAMATMATATEPSVFAHYTRVVSDAMQRVLETPGLSPHMRAYLSFRDDYETYFGRHRLPLDIFMMIEKHIDSPYAARAPVGKLKQGDAFYVAAMEPYERRHMPMATMNSRGELVVCLQKGDPVAQIAQVHGAYERKFPAPFVSRQKWPTTVQHYSIAFSATHFAVCTLRSNGDSYKWSIAIRPAEGIIADPLVRIEHMCRATTICHFPIVSNGDGTVYITVMDQANAAPCVIFRYKLDDKASCGYAMTKFVCNMISAQCYCATGDFLCVYSQHEPGRGYSVYDLPQEPSEPGASTNMRPYLRSFARLPAKDEAGLLVHTTSVSVCLDSTGTLLGLSIYPEWFELWTCSSADGYRDASNVLLNPKICRAVTWEYTPQPVLHPSGRIFVLYQELLGAGRHSIYAQELVKDVDEYKVCV